MGGDLGMAASEVHAKAGQVLGFWFGLAPEKWFAKDDAVDAAIAERFGALRDLVLGQGATGWRDDPETLLAAVILLDQFSRNLHRDTAEAFAGDTLAQELTLLALDRDWDAGMPAERRQFLYMPLMHAEDRELQVLCLTQFEALGDAYYLKFARDHADVIARFGRFPSRNAALGRESTPTEREYLSQPGAGW